MEEPELVLNDGSRKVFLNAAGTRGEISDEMKEFLQYFRTNKPGGSFTSTIENAVNIQRDNENGRLDYMFLSDIYDEYKEEGMEEGRKEERRTITEENVLRMSSKGMDVDEIADLLGLTVDKVKDILKGSPAAV